jgi:hypothetical protein
MADDLRVKVLGFFSKYKRDPATGNMREIDFVRFSPAQALNGQITEERVDFLRPSDDVDLDDDTRNRALKRTYMMALWQSIGPAYNAWKKGMEIPETGTPLSAWAGVTRDQAEALRKMDIRTVEELSSLDDSKLNRIPMPNARDVRDLARKFLTMGDDTRTADRLNELEKRNEALAEQLQAAMALLEERKDYRPEQDEVEALRRELDAQGVEYDGRWGVPKLREALNKVAA